MKRHTNTHHTQFRDAHKESEYISRPYYGDVIRRVDGVVVAPTSDDQHPDFLAWIAWCNEGNHPDEDFTLPPQEEKPVSVPTQVSPWQIRKALNQLNLRDTVENFVLHQSRDVRDGWEFATEFRRDDTMLNAMAPYLNLDLDAIFILAASL